MERFVGFLLAAHQGEEGHALPGLAALIGGAGAVLLGVGAANDNDALAIAGGIIAGVGILAATVVNHLTVDYDVYDRLEKLEKK